MKKPTWKLVVGILVMVLGGYGVVGGFFSILTTTYYAMEPEVEMVGKASDSDASNSEPPSHTAGGPEQRENSFRTPEQPSQPFTQSTSWTLASEVIAFLISGAYLLAGIFLITKPFGIRFFYSVLAASILWSVVQVALYSQAQISMLMILASMFAPSILIDLLLGGAVYVGNRQQPDEQTVSPDRGRSAEEPLVGLPKFLKVGVPILTGVPAALFALIIPFWIMGVPGVENDYARGWEMGLDVIMYYPIAWIIVFGISWFLKKRISIDRQPSLDIGISICLMIFLGLALLRLGQAFQLIAT